MATLKDTMSKPITITGKAIAINYGSRVYEPTGRENPGNFSYIPPETLKESGALPAHYSDWTIVGEATVTLTFSSREQMLQATIDTLRAQMAEHHAKANAIAGQIQNLMAIEHTTTL